MANAEGGFFYTLLVTSAASGCFLLIPLENNIRTFPFSTPFGPYTIIFFARTIFP